MWQLFMMIVVWNGNASYGGPMSVDGFKSEQACLAHAEKIRKSLPKEFVRKLGPDAVPKVEHSECIKIDA